MALERRQHAADYSKTRGTPAIRGIGLVLGFLVTGCANHYLIHPKTNPRDVISWNQEVVRGELLLNIEGARPTGDGPFPAVLVHPEAGREAKEMRGVIRSLAAEGYLAMAADYRRAAKRGYRRTLFTWREPRDARAAFDVLRHHPLVDALRIATLGYSQGGVYSLLIAAETQRVRAVVAYYPVTDFEHWLSGTERRGARRLVFRLIRRHFRRKSGAKTDEEFRSMLAQASAFRQAERIRAPVLLVHGNRDTTAGIVESERLAERLRALGSQVRLLEVEDAGHIFNFHNADKAEQAWEATVTWLDRHLRNAEVLMVD